MKKISLKSIKTEELLSIEELKQIMGGVAGSGNFSCYCPSAGSGLHYTITAKTEEQAIGAANAQSYFDGGTGNCVCEPI